MTAALAPIAFEPTDGGFVVELDQFSGPLDLLLTLIREEQLDIADLPIARVCEQFLARIHSLGLSEAAEYLEMAARLIRIKVQMLLPQRAEDEAWEDPRAELVRRLLEYQQMREVVDLLARRGEERRWRLTRGYLPEPTAAPSAPLALSLPELLAAVDRVLRMVREPDLHDVVPRPLDVDGAMATIRAVLALRAKVRWGDVVAREAAPWEVLSALLALLELARRGELKLRQRRPFSPMEISRETAG
ncbi:MAG TPA: segregation/condensation protein A [Gemmatimonadaceae bacterium]|nr:segregation/condensation protein A [Gemmatimonadaceae bacterium]